MKCKWSSTAWLLFLMLTEESRHVCKVLSTGLNLLLSISPTLHRRRHAEWKPFEMLCFLDKKSILLKIEQCCTLRWEIAQTDLSWLTERMWVLMSLRRFYWNTKNKHHFVTKFMWSDSQFKVEFISTGDAGCESCAQANANIYGSHPLRGMEGLFGKSHHWRH